MGSEVTSDPVVDGCRLGPGELCDLGDAVPSCHQEHRLNPAVGSDIGGATQGAGQSLPVAVIGAQFIWCSCSSHTQLRAKSIPRRTSGYLLSSDTTPAHSRRHRRPIPVLSSSAAPWG